MDNNQVEFKGTVVKCVYSSTNFKTYALDVDDVSYPNIQHNKFDNVSLIGDLSDLVIGIEYDVVSHRGADKIRYKLSCCKCT